MSVKAGGKPWWHSRTILGALVVVVATGLRLSGWEVDQGALLEIIADVVALAGAAVAIWGRIVAQQPIRNPRATRPGGKFNPKAEVRRAERARASLPGVWALALICGAAMAWADLRADTRGEAGRPVRSVATVREDGRPWWVRLVRSLRMKVKLGGDWHVREVLVTGEVEF